MTIFIPLYCVMLIFLVYFLGSNWAPPYHVSINAFNISDKNELGQVSKMFKSFCALLCVNNLNQKIKVHVHVINTIRY